MWTVAARGGCAPSLLGCPGYTARNPGDTVQNAESGGVISGLPHVADSVLNAPADLPHSQEPSVPTIYHVNLGGMFGSWWQHREGITSGSANRQAMR
jgi:hypothetical protein